jgi:hypothetical protein
LLTAEEQAAIADAVRRYQEAVTTLDRSRVEPFFSPRMQQQERNFALAAIEEARNLNLRGQVLPVSSIQPVGESAVVSLEGATPRLQLTLEGQNWRVLTTRYRPTSGQQSSVLPLGTPVDSGELRVTFTRVAYADSVAGIRPTPSGVFLVAFYNVQNLGREPKRPSTEFNAQLMVFDQEGRRWEYADELDKGNISGRFAVEDGKESPERPLGPGFSMDTAVAFEVPANATGLCIPVGSRQLVIPNR